MPLVIVALGGQSGQDTKETITSPPSGWVPLSPNPSGQMEALVKFKLQVEFSFETPLLVLRYYFQITSLRQSSIVLKIDGKRDGTQIRLILKFLQRGLNKPSPLCFNYLQTSLGFWQVFFHPWNILFAYSPNGQWLERADHDKTIILQMTSFEQVSVHMRRNYLNTVMQQELQFNFPEILTIRSQKAHLIIKKINKHLCQTSEIKNYRDMTHCNIAFKSKDL